MDSRGRLAKKLVKLVPSSPIESGVEIVAGDKSAGSITSAADGPNGPLALGYVKSAHLESSPLTVGAATVSIVELAS